MRGFATRMMGAVRAMRWSGRLFVLFVAALLVAGLAEIGTGLYIKAKARLAQTLLEQAWTATRTAGGIHKPWPWADTWPVARISVPALGRSAIVLAGASGQSLAFAPAHVNGTPMPGQSGVSVFAAHRDTHFAFLAALKPGDEIRVEAADGSVRTYEMTRGRVARWDRSGIDPTEPGQRLALVTCWPLEGREPGPLRYIAEARLKRPAITAAAAASRSGGQ